MRNLFAGLLSLVIIGLWSGHAAAHSALERSQPAADAVLAAPPATVQLWFSRGLEPAFSKVQVLDQAGKEVNQGNAAIKDKDAKQMEVGLSALPPGIYKVVWRIVALDGHKAKGEFRFSVK